MANEKRLIDANAFKSLLCKCCNILHSEESCEPSDCNVLAVIDEQPTVDAVVVVHGHWLYYSTTMQECSNCQRHTARHKFKYCPHCGAVMEDHYNDV
jgi:hypothetical protein